MPASQNQRRGRNPYQPPLPLAADPSMAGGPAGAPRGADQGDSGPGRFPARVARPRRPGPVATSRRPSPSGSQGWRLDENTRRAGRKGVAAARAALAGVTQPRHHGRADAA